MANAEDNTDPYDVGVSSFFLEALEGAERLLKCAAEMGKTSGVSCHHAIPANSLG
jgi:hypothetical protein